jgi:spore coat protein U-like protein
MLPFRTTLEFSLKKLALIALASAFAFTPVLALAATNTDTSPAQSGGQGEQVQYGQGRYMHTFSNISMAIPAFCTSLSADDVDFGSVANALTPSATKTMNVSWNCVSGVKPVIAFQSATNKCHLVSGVPQNQNADSLAGIPYSIKAANGTGPELCNADSHAPPYLYYPAPNKEWGTSSHTFYVATGVLVGGGYATFPVGTYTDQVQVYMSF